jgi:hypothetical protein
MWLHWFYLGGKSERSLEGIHAVAGMHMNDYKWLKLSLCTSELLDSKDVLISPTDCRWVCVDNKFDGTHVSCAICSPYWHHYLKEALE